MTLDINDDGTGVIEGIDVSDADVPGEWESTHVGGSSTPVVIAAGSKISFDVNDDTDNGVQVVGYMLALVSEKTG